MKGIAEQVSRGFLLLVMAGLSATLSGCPDPGPEPEPEPEPTPASRFRVPHVLTTDDAPEAVATGLVNGDAFPDVITANRGANTLTLWISDDGDGFEARQRLLTNGTEPRALALADLDGDGDLDIVSANSGSDNVSVFLGAGNGTFATAVVLPLAAGAEPRDVAVIDVNEDGEADIVTADSGLDTISMLIADGAGGFAAAETMATGAGPRALLVAEVNGDSRPDLLTADRDSNALSLFVNIADGTFQTRETIPTGSNPRMILGDDLDNDGRIDLIVSNPGSSNLGIHLGAGGGDFEGVVFVPVAGSPTRIVLGEYTGDDTDDILAILFDDTDDTQSSGRIQCLAGDGRGDFEPFDMYFAGAGVIALAPADFDRDGTPDLAACNLAEDDLLVIAGDDDTGLAMERRFATGARPRMTVVADFNRDNRPDVAVANLDGESVTILLGDGEGAFGEGTDIGVGGKARALAAADLNGDDRIDLAVTNLDESRVAILFGEGDGTFEAPGFLSVREEDSTGSAEPRSIVIADIDRDGGLDIITGNAGGDSVAVLLGDGEGAFTEAVEYDAGNFPLDVNLADINKDGKLDLVLVNGVDIDGAGTQTSALRVIPGKGDGTFDPANDIGYVSGFGPGSVVVADLDGDGDLDAATSHASLDNFQLYTGRGDGQFSAGGLVSTGDSPNAGGVTDVNGDGRPDLFTTNDGGSMTFRVHRRGLLYEQAETIRIGSRPVEGRLVDINRDSVLDIVVANRDTDDISVLLGQDD